MRWKIFISWWGLDGDARYFWKLLTIFLEFQLLRNFSIKFKKKSKKSAINFWKIQYKLQNWKGELITIRSAPRNGFLSHAKVVFPQQFYDYIFLSYFPFYISSLFPQNCFPCQTWKDFFFRILLATTRTTKHNLLFNLIFIFQWNFIDNRFFSCNKRISEYWKDLLIMTTKFQFE